MFVYIIILITNIYDFRNKKEININVIKYHEKTFYRIINYVVKGRKGLNVTTQLDILQSSIRKNVRRRRGQKRISASRTTREVFVTRDPTRGERAHDNSRM